MANYQQGYGVPFPSSTPNPQAAAAYAAQQQAAAYAQQQAAYAPGGYPVGYPQQQEVPGYPQQHAASPGLAYGQQVSPNGVTYNAMVPRTVTYTDPKTGRPAQGVQYIPASAAAPQHVATQQLPYSPTYAPTGYTSPTYPGPWQGGGGRGPNFPVYPGALTGLSEKERSRALKEYNKQVKEYEKESRKRMKEYEKERNRAEREEDKELRRAREREESMRDRERERGREREHEGLARGNTTRSRRNSRTDPYRAATADPYRAGPVDPYELERSMSRLNLDQRARRQSGGEGMRREQAEREREEFERLQGHRPSISGRRPEMGSEIPRPAYYPPGTAGAGMGVPIPSIPLSAGFEAPYGSRSRRNSVSIEPGVYGHQARSRRNSMEGGAYGTRSRRNSIEAGGVGRPRSRRNSIEANAYGGPRSRRNSIHEPGRNAGVPYGGHQQQQGAYMPQYGAQAQHGYGQPQYGLAGYNQPHAQSVVPASFMRPVSRDVDFAPFEKFVVIPNMDVILESLPPRPIYLRSHDVTKEDWNRLVYDLFSAWSGEMGRMLGRSRRSSLIIDIVETWNMEFFLKRGIEAVLFKGHERRTGEFGRGGVSEDEEDPDDDYETSSSSDSEEGFSDVERRGRYSYAPGEKWRYEGAERRLKELRRARRAQRERRRERRGTHARYAEGKLNGRYEEAYASGDKRWKERTREREREREHERVERERPWRLVMRCIPTRSPRVYARGLV